jgi:hypothetical protein
MFRDTEPFGMPAGESASPSSQRTTICRSLVQPMRPRFRPGWQGFSNCRAHRGITRAMKKPANQGRASV